ncbi:hypothetical protein JCM10212_000995 [Sporobolomyces blumeae]
MAPTSPSSPRRDRPRNAAFPHLAIDAVPTLDDVARLIRVGTARHVVVLAGAGISTGAGIPDFRSPKTGLYSNLAKYRLPYPEAIFDIDYLHDHPDAFYTLARELYPGNFEPTTTHYFFKLLQDEDLLTAVWTQNIDTLERIAGIDDDRVVEAHGSFESATCLRCAKRYDKDEIRDAIMRAEVVRCAEPTCIGHDDALVKPDIVFFGEGLPDKFFERLPDFDKCDLLIVLGTSLSVGPFNSLVHRVGRDVPRVLINLESVGEARPRPRFSSRRSTKGVPERSSRAGAEDDDDDQEEGFVFGDRREADSDQEDDRSWTDETSDDEEARSKDRSRPLATNDKSAKPTPSRRGGYRDVRWIGPSDAGIDKLCEMLGWTDALAKVKEQGLSRLRAGKQAQGAVDRSGTGERDGVERSDEAREARRRQEVIEEVEKAVERGDDATDPVGRDWIETGTGQGSQDERDEVDRLADEVKQAFI